MPNIQQLLSLKESFGTLDFSESQTKEFIERKRIKSDVIQKAFSFNERRLLENFSGTAKTPDLIKYFESSPSEEVVLLFIDITGFSRIMQNKTANELKRYLDEYYSKLIPIIYKHGGQIEKIMGDGIICVFGKPFIELKTTPRVISHAENCAKEAIVRLQNTNMAVKVALHIGKVTYYKVPTDLYDEYTMIGTPLTELYRLESVAEGNAINFYANSQYDTLNPKDGSNFWTDIDKNNVAIRTKTINVPGVNFNQLRYLTFVS